LSYAAKWKEALGRIDDVQYMQLLERENARIESESKALREDIQPKLVELPDIVDLRLKCYSLESKLQALETIRVDIEELPEDLTGVMKLIERLYPDRILFSPTALKSATIARINQVSSGVGIAWKILRAMALQLHDLHREGAADISRRFQDCSGFELARGEGPATRQDSELMRTRMIEHDGVSIDTSAHIKYGQRQPKLLRVYYGFCGECSRLVIGHCGDHLTTAGTRRIA
jgi:hypothetical protein